MQVLLNMNLRMSVLKVLLWDDYTAALKALAGFEIHRSQDDRSLAAFIAFILDRVNVGFSWLRSDAESFSAFLLALAALFFSLARFPHRFSGEKKRGPSMSCLVNDIPTRESPNAGSHESFST